MTSTKAMLRRGWRTFLRHRDKIVWSLNVVGLLITVGAAFVLYWYPPRFAPSYTESGEQKVTFINPATPEGKAYAKQWERYAWWGPVLLIVGFLAQFVAAILGSPFVQDHHQHGPAR